MDDDRRIRSTVTQDIAVFVANDFDADDWAIWNTEKATAWEDVKAQLGQLHEQILVATGKPVFDLTWNTAEKHFTQMKLPSKTFEDYKNNIGSKVSKISDKYFKNKEKIITVKDVVEHPITKKPAYTFYEDPSYVECFKCKVVE